MPSLASKSSGAHQVSLNHSTKLAVHISIISEALFSCSLLFLRLEGYEEKGKFKKTSSLSDMTAALSGGWGAGCSSPGCLLVTCCDVGFRGDRSVTTAAKC